MKSQSKKLTKEQAARKLYAILEKHVSSLPPEEQERRWARLKARVAKYRRTRAKPAKPSQIRRSRVAARIR